MTDQAYRPLLDLLEPKVCRFGLYDVLSWAAAAALWRLGPRPYLGPTEGELREDVTLVDWHIRRLRNMQGPWCDIFSPVIYELQRVSKDPRVPSIPEHWETEIGTRAEGSGFQRTAVVLIQFKPCGVGAGALKCLEEISKLHKSSVEGKDKERWPSSWTVELDEPTSELFTQLAFIQVLEALAYLQAAGMAPAVEISAPPDLTRSLDPNTSTRWQSSLRAIQ